MYKIILFIAVTLFINLSCYNNKRSIDGDSKTDSLNIRYAKGFNILYKGNTKIINIFNPWSGANQQLQYILYPKGEKSTFKENNAVFIEYPVKSVVCLSTTHLAMFEFIGEEHSIKGISNIKYVNSQKINSLIKQHKIVDVGIDQNLNFETILDIKPDIVMVYGLANSGFDTYKRLEDEGIKIIYNAEFLENNPLGKAEWVKFVAAFFGKEKLVDKKFDEVAGEYMKYSEIAKNKSLAKPTVFANVAWKGTWYVPGGESYMAKFFEDAGAKYIWKDDKSFNSIPLNFEGVLEKCVSADYWLNIGTANSINEITGLDERYKYFEALKSGKVYNNNKKLGINGGNDFWEIGSVRPDIILKDLIKIFHPELLPKYELFFYKKIK